MTATLVTGLVMEASRKMESARMGVLDRHP